MKNKQTNKQKQKQKNITERKLKFPTLNNIHARHFPCTIISFFELKTSSFYNLNGPKFRAKLHNTHISVFIAINFQLALEGILHHNVVLETAKKPIMGSNTELSKR